jgi:hypothetical protein
MASERNLGVFGGEGMKNKKKKVATDLQIWMDCLNLD